ncbi:MAG: MarR family transcriptional regulator [Oscillibacter sp.]
MELRDSLNQFYYDTTVNDLRQLSRSASGELSYNSIMYLDVISFQQEQGHCTISSLAETLRISKSAATMKIGELVRLGLIERTRSDRDRRVVYLTLSGPAAQALSAYDRPFERAVRQIESQFTPAQIETFCTILGTFSLEFGKDF